MEKLKKLMRGYKFRILGNYKIEKHIAHAFNKNFDEYFCYVYIIEKIA